MGHVKSSFREGHLFHEDIHFSNHLRGFNSDDPISGVQQFKRPGPGHRGVRRGAGGEGRRTAGNALLRGIGDGVECRVCPALADAPLCDVDLAGVRLPRGGPWPRRYVALNPADPEVRRRLQLLAARPGHGAFLWLDWLIDHSELLAGDAARLRERAAAAALEELA